MVQILKVFGVFGEENISWLKSLKYLWWRKYFLVKIFGAFGEENILWFKSLKYSVSAVMKIFYG